MYPVTADNLLMKSYQGCQKALLAGLCLLPLSHALIANSG